MVMLTMSHEKHFIDAIGRTNKNVHDDVKTINFAKDNGGVKLVVFIKNCGMLRTINVD